MQRDPLRLLQLKIEYILRLKSSVHKNRSIQHLDKQ